MSESSRIETLLEALVDGENVDVVPQSRIETYLLALLNGDTNVKEPQSRIEAYLYQLCKNGMSGGGITPTGTLEITENGTHDVTNYASANVNVASSGGGSDLDALIDGSITEVSSNVESVRKEAFYLCSELVSANFPKAQSIGGLTFSECSKLKSVNIPLATLIGSYAFQKCYELLSVNMPNVKTIENYAFFECMKLESVKLPLVTKVAFYAFRECYNLKLVDFAKAVYIRSNTFHRCYSLKHVILRKDIVYSLEDINAFEYCFHILGTVDATYNPNGDKDGYIYVPKALLSDTDETKDYRRATNWTTYASQFRALEDYTVDGTITGELDETKI